MRQVEGRPLWNEQQAAVLVGATVMIGLTYVRTEGSSQEQMFGVIRSADARHGFEVVLDGSRNGETYWLPPHLRNFFPARPGEYRLRTTGEVIIDPDYTCSWTVRPGAH